VSGARDGAAIASVPRRFGEPTWRSLQVSRNRVP
jgi:hypothetical protein